MGEGENVMVIARRHPLFLVGRVALFVIAAVVLIGAGVWVATTSVTLYVAGFLWLIAIIPIGFAALRYIAWKNEIYAVTNFRIIQVEGVLSRRVFDSSLEMVNDILMTQSLIGRLLNYGTVEIITGSDIGLNKLDALKDPFAFKRAIIDARNSLSDHGRAPVVEGQKSQLLSALQDLKTSGLLTDAEYEIKRARVDGGRSE
jgi:uncharacterized membrane protein YdbT with pleckstrin-like domain